MQLANSEIRADATEASVRAILAEVLHRPTDVVPLSADLEADLGVDSLAMIEISVELEARFDIRMPPGASPDDLALQTVGDVVRFVDQLRAGGNR